MFMLIYCDFLKVFLFKHFSFELKYLRVNLLIFLQRSTVSSDSFMPDGS